MSEMTPDAEVPSSWNCLGCGRENVGEDNIGYFSNAGNGNVCTDCHEVCPDCNRDFNRNNGNSHAYYSGDYYCRMCTRESFFMCYDCDEWEHTDNSHSTRHGNYVCSACRDDHYFYCDDCNETIHEDDNYHDDYCRPQFINDYSYRPAPIFYHLNSEFDEAPTILKDSGRISRKYRQIAYLGLEIEVESNGASLREGADIFGTEEDLFYLKTDGSLNDGFEIVTHPMTLEWVQENFPFDKLQELSDLGFDAWDAGTTGLHIHVSRDGFKSMSHQAYFVNFITRNQLFFEALAGRSGERWAKFDRDNLKRINHRLKRSLHTDRYSAVNVQNVPTLEVRIFRSSLKRERLLMAMELVDACVKYTENLTCKDVIQGYAFDAQTFAGWVSNQATQRYATLNTYITEFLTTGQIGE